MKAERDSSAPPAADPEDIEVREIGMWFLQHGLRADGPRALEKSARLRSIVEAAALELIG